MTIQVAKTKAETALAEAFAAAAATLPGGEAVQALRRAAIGKFQAEGLPHRRVEEWKYTDLRTLLREAYPLATGTAVSAADGDALVARLFPGVACEWAIIADGRGAAASKAFPAKTPFLANVLADPPAWVRDALAQHAAADGAEALNAALFSDGLVLDIPADAAPDKPIVLVLSGSAANTSVVTRNIIRIGARAKVVLVEAHAGPVQQTSAATTLTIGEGAEVVHVKHIATEAGATHLGKWTVTLGAEAVYRPFQMTIGNGVARSEIALAFEGERGSFDLGAATLLAGHGHGDTTLVIDHKVPHCTSRELVKAVLDDEARGIFQGKVIVRPDAQKTDGKQMAQALMLSPNAEFDSKPELEIYADDVVCGHGSTSAELDQDLLFYMRARGIPLVEARALLIESFIGEAIDKVAHEGLRDALMATARRWLGEGHVDRKGAKC